MPHKTVLAVDGHSLMYRAFHAIRLLDADGVYTNAVFGFMSMLISALTQHKPDILVVAFDEKAPIFRSGDYEDYKAGRAAMPDELRPQFQVIKDILLAMGAGVISLPGYEADDLLGTVSKKAAEAGMTSLILTGDKDALQLVDDTTHVIYTVKGVTQSIDFTPALVRDHYGVTPEQVTDWKGLMGDPSDNIPGVPGVGTKTAVKLLQEYGTLDKVLENADSIPGKLGERLREHKQDALDSRQLAVIDRDVPLAMDFASWDLDNPLGAVPLMRQYRLNTLSERLIKLYPDSEAPEAAAPVKAGAVWRDIVDLAELTALVKQGLPSPLPLHWHEDALTFQEKEGHFVRLTLAPEAPDLLTAAQGLDVAHVFGALKPALAGGIVTHDGKALFHRLADGGVAHPPLAWDTKIAQYLISPQESSYQLSAFAKGDAEGLVNLWRAQEKTLEDEQTMVLYRTIELPLVTVLFEMERLGFMVDAGVLKELGDQFSAQAEALRSEIIALTGEPDLNVNSPQQLGRVLFEKMGLPSGRKTKLGYSTDAETLEGLSAHHPVADKILSYRSVTKLNATYIEALTKKRDGAGRVHTTFDQTATATGRLSSVDPNLQNIPIRTEQGAQIRRAFVARPGHVLVDADYSQIELRILAHLSQDKGMIAAFVAGRDIHTVTAAEINGVPLQDVTPAMRSAAKAVNFGIVYGISDFGLARNIGITQRRAADFIQKYFERYPGVQQYMQTCVNDAMQRGYALTLFKRRRAIPELTSPNMRQRNFGERAAMNTPIQGSAADIMKLAMDRVAERLEKEKLSARPILQVHDELIIECPDSEVAPVKALLVDEMENAVRLAVPLVVDVGVGPSWFDAK